MKCTTTCLLLLVGLFAVGCASSTCRQSADAGGDLGTMRSLQPYGVINCDWCVGSQNLRVDMPPDVGGLSTGTDGDPYTVPCGSIGYVFWSVEYRADANHDGAADCCWDGATYGYGQQGIPDGCASYWRVVNSLPHKIGDGDADGDIDNVDVSIMEWCRTLPPEHAKWDCCLCNFDFDGDGDVDGEDEDVLLGDVGLNVFDILLDSWGAP